VLDIDDPDELVCEEDLQRANLDCFCIALWCLRAFWALKAAVLGASPSSERGPLDAGALYIVVSSFKKCHPELWGAVQDLGIQMPGLLNPIELEVVERVNWIQP
jgi:hypothetical protein